MALSLGDLARVARAELRGDATMAIDRVDTLERAGPGAISFLANPRYRRHLAQTRASAVILDERDAPTCPTACLVSDNPYLSHARVVTALHPPPRARPGVHPSAVIDASASLSASAEVGPNAYIGPRVHVGEDVIIGPGCVLLDGVRVGRGTRLVAAVTLGPGAELGERCLIHPGAVIGGDGFGLAEDRGAWVKVPQLGRAVLGDDVEVGSCSSIDRGAIDDTRIGNGVKIDSQVHVAHNVVIGEHTAMAGRSAIAGSSRIGAHCTIAGGAGVTGHVELADHVHVSGVSSVTRSIREPGLYTGTVPAMAHDVWRKNFARLRYLDAIVRRVGALEREVADLRAGRDEDAASASRGDADGEG